jgi:hypothetical protein
MPNDFQKENAFPGINAASSSERQHEGNGVAERFIRPLKENPMWSETWRQTIEKLRLARLYYDNWLVA